MQSEDGTTCVTYPAVHRPATPQPQRPPASPDRTCAAAHCPWDYDYDVLLAIHHLLAATALRPHTNQQTLDPHKPDHPMQPHAESPAATADQSAEDQQQEPDGATTPPPRKDIYATLASTLALPMDAEVYYHCVLGELPANQATLQGWRQAKGGDN